jgi:transcriptional regulator with XRE-family HTH domain
MPQGRRRTKKQGLRGSSFKKYAVTLPKTLEVRPRRGKSVTLEAAESLATMKFPLAISSAAMIDGMRQGLKLAIKELRGELTQEAFARRIGITQAALARMESLNNEVFPSTPLLIRIALVSGRDLRVSFVNRLTETFDAEKPLLDMVGFPSPAPSEGYPVMLQQRLRNRVSYDSAREISLPTPAKKGQ